MNEHASPKSMRSSIWSAARAKNNKKIWNYVRAKDRGQIAALPSTLKKVGFKGDIYKLGQYVGPLEDLKEFARFKGLTVLTFGAIKYKL